MRINAQWRSAISKGARVYKQGSRSIALRPHPPHHSTIPRRPFSEMASLQPTISASSENVKADTSNNRGGRNGPRNIVILLDGTANQFSDKNSNLIKLMSVLKADETQLLYYSSGLGTVLPAGTSTWSKLKETTAEVMDMAFAWNFEAFVCDAYKFLVDYYQTGDKIYLFGFSRGAYTARALAGMIQRVGLLNPGNHNQIALAYDVYKGPKEIKDPHGNTKDPAVLYRRIFGRSRLVSIEFVGVWDTVSSLGGFDLPQLPFASGSKSVRYFRQALALDERRVRFTPEYWRTDEEHLRLQQQLHDAKLAAERAPRAAETDGTRASSLPELERRLERDYASRDPDTGMVTNLEVWFMGCHSDVGGGNDLNDDPSLSNIPFRWMLREAVRCGILLDASGFALLPALRPPNRGDPSNDPCAWAQNLSDILPPIEGHPAIDVAILAELDNLAKILTAQVTDARLEMSHYNEIRACSSLVTQDALRQILEVLTDFDARAPIAMNTDALQPLNESLSVWYLPLEMLPLQTRVYSASGEKKRDKTILHFGQGRQMVPGQKIHKSVHNRLVYDQQRSHRLLKAERYYGPAARVAVDMPSWALVREGRATDSDAWAE